MGCYKIKRSLSLRMARPINADATATRERILRSATELFGSHGAAASSVRQIARASGVSVAMVHHYFGSKDGLYDACVAAMDDELVLLKRELMATPTEDWQELLGQTVRRTFRFSYARRSVVRLMMRSVVTEGTLPGTRLQDTLLPFIEQTTTLLAERTGRTAASFRLPLQSLIFLIGRYSAGDVRELRAVSLPLVRLGGEGEDNAAFDASKLSDALVLEMIEAHLVTCAGQLFGAPALCEGQPGLPSLSR